MKSKELLLLSIISGLIILGVGFLIYFDRGWFSEDEISNDGTNSAQVADPFTYRIVGDDGVLGLRGGDFSVSIPLSFFSLSQAELAAMNVPDGEYELWRQCGILYRELKGDSFFWISYGQAGLCATEKTFSMIDDESFQGSMQGICARLEARQQYRDCEPLQKGPNGFTGVSFYEYVPDYGVADSGAVARTVYLRPMTEGSKQAMLFSFMPGWRNGARRPISDFPESVEALANNQDAGVMSQLTAFEEIIRSIELNSR